MATLKDFEKDKKEILAMVDSIHKVCKSDTNENLESDIKFKLLKLHEKVKQTNSTLENFLNDLSNIEPKPLAKLKDSLQELIGTLERSVCVPEFCINSDIHSSCQYLTKKLIEHLQEITFCYDLSDMPRATNKGVPKKEKSRANSVYLSLAPSESELIESAMRKKSIKCKRKRAREESTRLSTLKNSAKTVTRTGRFTVSAVNYSPEDTDATVGKKKGRKGKGRGSKQSQKKKPVKGANEDKKKKSKRTKKKSKN